MTEGAEAARRILIVDDESILLLSLRQLLHLGLGPGLRIDIALAAEEGISILDEARAEGERIHLLISDWFMPGMKGDEFLMRARESEPSLRTILISGQTDEDSLKNLSESGALDHFIRKPWVRGEILSACRRLLGIQ